MLTLTEEGVDSLADFVTFGKAMLASRDIDPIYPILGYINGAKKLDTEQQLWLSFLYVAWYHLPVGLHTWLRFPYPDRRVIMWLDEKWPTGIERRSNRGGKVRQHITSYLDEVEKVGTQEDWYMKAYSFAVESQSELHENWRQMNEHLQTLWGNGRWAAYKHLEILRRVHGLPVEAPDMGNQFSSGPRKGLAHFFPEVPGQTAKAVRALDAQGRKLQRAVERLGLKVDIEELETLLCNWHSMTKGNYYVGHDIDELLEQCHRFDKEPVVNLILEARDACFDYRYLGEYGGWDGVRKDRAQAYKKHGRVLT